MQDATERFAADADDYHQGEPDEQVFPAKVEALLRRFRAQRPRPELGDTAPFSFNSGLRTVQLGDEFIELTEKEYSLAHYLFENAGNVVPRSQLLANVWGVHPDLNTRTVDAHASRLRKKLRLDARSGWKLVSVYGKGYRLERAAPPAAQRNARAGLHAAAVNF